MAENQDTEKMAAICAQEGDFLPPSRYHRRMTAQRKTAAARRTSAHF